ncbi:MAG: amidase family protein [Gaiellales bacterium]
MTADDRVLGHLRAPTPGDLHQCATRERLGLTEEECEALAPFAAQWVRALDDVEALPELVVEPGSPRSSGRRPSRDEDPLNAFIRLCDVRGAEDGPLAGRRIGIKDNIAVAGVPLTNGSRTLSFTPTQDAVVVERILAAGGTIVGKLNLDDFSASGFGDSGAFGPTRNPVRPTHSPGGSSSGSGAAVASGLVDIALGVDQGGSIRMPAAQCGIVGLKATHGLVPTTGVTHMDHTLDCIGPMARTVADVALMLGVIAGEDWRDPQWTRHVALDDYLAPLGDGVDGVRVGIVSEAFADPACQRPIVENLATAASALERSGATVSQVSLPLWTSSFAIWLGTLIGGWAPMLRSNGRGTGHLGLVDVDRVHAAGVVLGDEGRLLPPTLKLALLLDSYLHERYHGVPLARAHNQRLRLRAELDAALGSFDVLLAPTVTRVATELPAGRLEPAVAMSRIVSEVLPAVPANVTGHPALAVPTGTDPDGLPTSLQVIGARFAERRVLSVGAAIEAAGASERPR